MQKEPAEFKITCKSKALNKYDFQSYSLFQIIQTIICFNSCKYKTFYYISQNTVLYLESLLTKCFSKTRICIKIFHTDNFIPMFIGQKNEF